MHAERAYGGSTRDGFVGSEIAQAGRTPDQSQAGPRVYSARALVSEAQAQLATGHPGFAILDYERARLLAPRWPGVVAGLEQARTVANLAPPESGLGGRTVRLLGADEWGWIALAGLGVIALGVVAFAWRFVRLRGLLAMSLVGAGVGCLGLLAARTVAPPPGRAIVVAADAVARIAPFAAAERAFVAPEGATVTVERTHGAYALIAGSDGRGWVPHDVVETIVPGSGPHA